MKQLRRNKRTAQVRYNEGIFITKCGHHDKSEVSSLSPGQVTGPYSSYF